MLVSFVVMLLVCSSFNFSVFASTDLDEKKDYVYKSPIERDSELNDLIPVDEEVNAYAEVFEVSGPIKHVNYVSNYQLANLINVRKNQQGILEAMELILGLLKYSNYATNVNSAARIIERSPIDRMVHAYYTGEHMYVGEYYSTPHVGLSTVPFIIYSKNRIVFRGPNGQDY